MKLSESLYNEIGNVDKEDVLIKAIAILLLKYLSNEKESKKEDEEEYGINEAFLDTFKRHKPVKKEIPELIPYTS